MEFYLDVSAVGGAYQVYADTPTTWGVPQDGNGLSTNAGAAAVSVVEITFAAVPTSGAISVYGTTVTLAGVLSAASTSAAAAALAASINATTTAVGTSVSAVGLALNRFVFARVKPGGGANNSVVQVMCRIAGGDLNYPANASARVANTFNNAAVTSPLDFTGGVDGPFGYYSNNSTVFGRTAYTYGLFNSPAGSATEPGIDDVIHVRTAVGGSSLTVTLTTDIALTSTFTHHNYRYDDGTVWSGDSGTFKLHFNIGTSGGQRTWTLGSCVHVAAQPNNFVVQLTGGGTGFLLFVGASSTTTLGFFGVKFEEQPSVPSGYQGFKFRNCHLEECWLYFTYPRSFALANSAPAIAKFERCRFTAVSMSAKWTSFVSLAAAAGGSGDVVVEFRGGGFDEANAFTADAPCIGTPNAGNVRVVFDSVRGLDFSVASLPASYRYGLYSFLYVSPEESRQFRYECGTHIVDWRTGASYPTLSARLPNGGPWVQRLLWQPVTAPSKTVAAIKLAMFYRGASAAKTVTLNMMVPDAITLTKADIALVLRYQDASEVVRHETTRVDWTRKLLGTAAALDSSSAAWAGVPAGYSAKKLEITTSQAVKPNTELVATLHLIGSPVSQVVVYVDPEVGIA